MPIYHDCAQYSDEYDRLKLGLPTSSNFHKILTPTGEPSKQWKPYAFHLIAERLLGRKVDTFTSPHMERGLIVETEAADWYDFDRDVVTRQIGFITDDDRTVGCSPDRLVGDQGLLEIKAPLPQTQVEYLIEGRPHRKHKPQLQGQLFVSEREWVDILCWHDSLPRIVVRAERDEMFISSLERELRKFNEYIDGVMEKIQSVSGQPAPKAVLRDMLRATLQSEIV